jgi:hypothetical protein
MEKTMPKVINAETNTTIVEDVVQIPTESSQTTLNGSWDDESLSLEERIQSISDEIQRLENESVTKRYTIEGGLNTADELKKFIHDRVKWRFTDAFLVCNVHSELEQAIKECRKTQTFEITGIFIEPILQMLQSAEGVGFQSAKTFYEKLLVPISETVNIYRKDTTLLQNLKLKLGALDNNLNPNELEPNED